MRLFKLPLRVIACVEDISGKAIRMDRTVEGCDGIELAMLVALLSREDKGLPFNGCIVTGMPSRGSRVLRVFDFKNLKLLERGFALQKETEND